MVKRIFILFFLFLVFVSPVYVNASSETTLYFGSLEKNLNTGEKKIYIPVGNSMAVKILNSNGSTKNTSYIHSDHLGSTVLITKQDGSIDSSMVYYPYGNGVGGRTPALQTDKLYTSQRLDYSTSLYFYNARYYNPKTGRFISADSAQGPNRYAYVGNNPVMNNDPSGNEGSPPVVYTGDKAVNFINNYVVSDEQYYQTVHREEYRKQQLIKGAGYTAVFMTGVVGAAYAPAVGGVLSDSSLLQKIAEGGVGLWKILNGSKAKETTAKLLTEVEDYGLKWMEKSPAGKGSAGSLTSGVGKNNFFGVTSTQDLMIGGKQIPRLMAHELTHLEQADQLLKNGGSPAIMDFKAFQHTYEVQAYWEGAKTAFKTGDLWGSATHSMGMMINYYQHLLQTVPEVATQQLGGLTISVIQEAYKRPN